jgi:hypothetical protein
LRLTEYYQGILFLTTNRVETFDEAFQSRIHMGIRYENLQAKARKKIWQHHVGKVEQMGREAEAEKKSKNSAKEGGDVKTKVEKIEEVMKPFTEADFDELSKKSMNGRQVRLLVARKIWEGQLTHNRRSRTRSKRRNRSRSRRSQCSAWSMSSVCSRSLRRSRMTCVAARATAMR